MYVKIFRHGDSHLVATSFSEGRIAIAHYESARVISDVRLPQDCLTGFDVSPERSLLVTAYGDAWGVDLWDLQTCSRIKNYGPPRVNAAVFDRGASCVLLSAARGSFVQNLENDARVEVHRCWSLAAVAWQDGLLSRCSSKRTLVYVTFCPVASEKKTIAGTNGVIWTLAVSPKNGDLCVIDSGGRLCCFSDIANSPKWSTALEKSFSWMTYSGNGELIAVSGNDPRQTVVLEAQSGTVLRTHKDIFGGTSPFIGDSVMTSFGEILNLRTGQVDKSISRPEWWRAAGLKKLTE